MWLLKYSSFLILWFGNYKLLHRAESMSLKMERKRWKILTLSLSLKVGGGGGGGGNPFCFLFQRKGRSALIMNLPGVHLIRIIIIWKWCAACIQAPKTFSSDIKFLLILRFVVSSSTRKNNIRSLKCWFSWFIRSHSQEHCLLEGFVLELIQYTKNN